MDILNWFKRKPENISEPVITLLDELEKDVWDWECVPGENRLSHKFKAVSIKYGDNYRGGVSCYGMPWLTRYENKLVVNAVLKAAKVAHISLKNVDRIAFGKALGVM